MGWSSGAKLAERIWAAVEQHIPADKVDEVAAAIVDAFVGYDCDTLQEVNGPVGTAASRRDHARWGAPPNPRAGDTYTYGSAVTYQFDGRRWRLVEE